ncbi:alpha/beta hydrolase [Tropicimonas sp. TH_r6]|uniref:alpha/beta hydrolase n=1 Tax=Tropicimonas sp. TH_r6 TaxID=3082085 RepID=UPI0029541B33|nr:alpha/beta hydrolase [Tropicimonas sp. TH_r6]MDV7145450.1 alpha/beta hydrolase [Tropicimonas sp. TH_r6]
MTPDYDRLLDAETRAFIQRTDSFYPPDTGTRSIREQRTLYDEMSRAFQVPRPEGVTVTDRHVGAVPVRDYRRDGATARVLFFHGGGFAVGGLDSHDDLCAEICARTGVDVTAVAYRLAPEHCFPADLDDARTVWRDLAAQPGGRIVLVGDSAGGTLCAGLSHELRTAPRRPDGQVLIYPGLGFQPGSASMETHAAAPMLSREDCIFYRDLRVGERSDLLTDPRCSPLRAERFDRLPPTVAFAAECDPLSDEAVAYTDAIRAAGGSARSVRETGLVHGYLRARHSVARARESFERILDAIASLGAGLPVAPPPGDSA